jgi:pimeloyl-ACP methyl ester carboxylesterase
VSAYSEQFRCVLVDNRGAGRSGKPAGPYSTTQMADDCARVVSAVTDEPAAVVGLSTGGAVAHELAFRHRSLVRRLVLVSTWARCDGYLSEIFDHLDVAHSKLDPDEFARDESFTVLEDAERINRAIPSSQLEAFPGGGHAHRWENLKAFNDLLFAWLDDRHTGHHAQLASGAEMRHEGKAG